MIYSFGEIASSSGCSLEARQAREAGVQFYYGKHKAFSRLSELPPGTRALLVRIEGDNILQERMTAQGLFPGNLVKILPPKDTSSGKDDTIRLCSDFLETTIFRVEGQHLLVCPFSVKKETFFPPPGKSSLFEELYKAYTLYSKTLKAFVLKKHAGSSFL